MVTYLMLLNWTDHGMKNVKDSPKRLDGVKKLAKDFALDEGKFRLTAKKMNGWVAELDKVSETDRPRTAQELIALAMRFEREGGEPAAQGAAQLYVFAAGLLNKSAPNAKAKVKAKKKSWGAK